MLYFHKYYYYFYHYVVNHCNVHLNIFTNKVSLLCFIFRNIFIIFITSMFLIIVMYI